MQSFDILVPLKAALLSGCELHRRSRSFGKGNTTADDCLLHTALVCMIATLHTRTHTKAGRVRPEMGRRLTEAEKPLKTR